MGENISRRGLLRGVAGVGLAALVPAELLAACSSPTRRSGRFAVFTGHEMAVITEAAARLIPGPTDEASEAGHPGAREANVANYISSMIGAFAFDPPRVFAGGPYSNRAGSTVDDMANFLPLSESATPVWRSRLMALQKIYQAGIAAYDSRARLRGAPSFLALGSPARDAVLTTNPVVSGLPDGYSGFTDMLFAHAIEGTYSVPEYGGNSGLRGWQDIAFPGDVQPRGYTDEQVSGPLNHRPYQHQPPVDAVLRLLTVTAPAPVKPDRPV